MPTREVQPTHAELAEALKALNKQLGDLKSELAAHRAEMQPVSDAYKAATIGARVLKWGVGVLAGLAAIVGFVWQLKTGG